MPGIVHFAALAVGVVVCAFVGTQLAALRGLHIQPLDIGAIPGVPSSRYVMRSCLSLQRRVRAVTFALTLVHVRPQAGTTLRAPVRAATRCGAA